MPAAPADAPRTRWTLQGFVEAALYVGLLGALPLCLLSLVALVGDRHWLPELTTHFRPHYATLLGASAAAYALARWFRCAAVFALCCALNTAMLLPRIGSHDTPPPEAPRVKLLLANVLTDNPRHRPLLDLIAAEKPDVVALLEVNARWHAALAPLLATHPHTHGIPRADNFGILLYSRLPLADAKVVYHGASEVPSIRATLHLDGRPVQLLATHPLPPGTADGTTLRDQQLSKIAAWSAASPHPVIVIGDLNCTPWSPAFRRFARDGHLADTARRLNTTWPSRPWWLRIPIDHCLASPEFLSLENRVGPDIGSDHLPLVVTLALPAPARPTAASHL